MIVEYVRYRAPDGRAEPLINAYRAAAAALRASPECLSFELARCRESPDSLVLRIEWTSLEGHLEGFRKSASFRTFLEHVGPFVSAIEEMRHYEVTDVRSVDSIYEAVGGVATFFRIAHAMHQRMSSDAILGARFAAAAQSHVPHLAMWLTEVFGGPKLYSETLGDLSSMLSRHAGLAITELERARFVEVACDACASVVPSGQERALAAFRRYIEWGSHVAVANAAPGHVPDPTADVPAWDWDAVG